MHFFIVHVDKLIWFNFNDIILIDIVTFIIVIAIMLILMISSFQM